MSANEPLFTLRSGIKVDGVLLTAERLEEIAALDPANCEESVHELIDVLRDRAEMIVRAGLQSRLRLDDLSWFEVSLIAAARADEMRRDRETLAGLIALALGREKGLDLLPDDEVVARIKWYASMAQRASEVMKGAR